jgi:hypothetical protein
MVLKNNQLQIDGLEVLAPQKKTTRVIFQSFQGVQQCLVALK